MRTETNTNLIDKMKLVALSVVSFLLLLHLGSWWIWGPKGAAMFSLGFYILLLAGIVIAPLIQEEAEMEAMDRQ
jgi:hypothetical protein